MLKKIGWVALLLLAAIIGANLADRHAARQRAELWAEATKPRN